MAWNGPINGDYSDVDFTKPPWANGIMTLTHDEVVYVQDQVPDIVANYVPETGESAEPTDSYIISTYNRDYANDWERAINGDTYDVIKGYDPEVHTEGIDSSGIVGEGPNGN